LFSVTQKLFAIIGPTGTGKTSLSIDLAEAMSSAPAEIVNADAMQLYQGMDIGTAKLSKAERARVPHHLFDTLHVTQESTAAAYQVQAREIISQIQSRQATPILVGGSGLYVSSALFEFEFPGTNATIREQLEREFAANGIESLMMRLTEVDPAGAAAVDGQNARRVIRALEIFEMTGKPAKIGLPETPVFWREASIVGLREDRALLTERLNERVLEMWRAGFLDEVAELRDAGIERGLTASRAIGYAQALAQLRGELNQTQAIEQTQALTRRYARRQMSWFKRYPNTRWFQAGANNLAQRILDTEDPGDF
jgi:tRNA dimethylallyltransferase